MVGRIIKIIAFSITGLVGIIIILLVILFGSQPEHLRLYPPVPHKAAYEIPQGASFPQALHAQGNQLATESGDPVRLRGLMIPDPGRLYQEKRLDQALIAEIQATGANVIRIPVHPEYWLEDKDYLWRNLDPLVTWAGEAGLYVIIDLHFIGNIATGEGDQMPDLDLPAAEFADQFWSQVAPYFRNAPHVIFEIYNEPADISTVEWMTSSSHLVELIRSWGVEQTLIIGGVDYSRDLSWVLDNPLEDDNLAYASHIYPSHSQSNWEYWFGSVAAQYPVVITEWGFQDPPTAAGQAYLIGDVESYGEPLLAYLDEIDAGWVACWYDDEWAPAIFKPGRASMTEYGQWVIDELKQTNGLPSDSYILERILDREI